MNKSEYVGSDVKTFQDFLDNVGHLSLEKESLRVFYIKDGESVDACITWEALGAVHENLPAAIKHMLSSDQPIVTPLRINNTLALWKHPYPVIDAEGRAHHILEVDQILVLNRVTRSVDLYATEWIIRTVEDLSYVRYTENTEKFTVTIDELDKHYPGWLVKYDVLAALETNVHDLANKVFVRAENQPSTPIVLNSITFD